MSSKKKVPNATTVAAMQNSRELASKAMPNTPNALFAATAPKSMLQRAHDTIHGQRQQDYGDKLQNFAQTAMIWQGILAPKLQVTATITPEDVALLMIALKMSRLSKTPMHEDSWLDIAGYAGCAAILQEERAKGVELLGATVDSGAPF